MNVHQPYPFLFIHGAGGTKHKWRTLTSLENESRFIDLPGHGENENSQCETIEEYAKQVATEVKEDCIVVGHSMGGLIALELAKIESKVKAVVLAASSYQLPVHPDIIATLAKGTFPEELFRASYAKNVRPGLLETEKQQLDMTPTEVAKKDFIACDRYSAGKEAIKTLEVPILAILGDADRLIPKDTANVLQQINPNVKIATLFECGHYVALEKPDEFTHALLEFRASL